MNVNVQNANSQALPAADLLSRVVRAKDVPWQPTRFPGCHTKTLLFDPKSGLVTLLFKMDPGWVFR